LRQGHSKVACVAETSVTIALERFKTFGDLLKYLRRRSGLTQRELSIAVGYSVPQISRLEQNQRLPDLASITARFLPALQTENEPTVAARLLELAAAMRQEDAPASGLPPFKGLLCFDEGDADVFFGRETLTEALVARLTSGAEQAERFLAVVGASGSGKSSVVRAGVIPALRWRTTSAGWPAAVITPTAHPLEALAASLAGDREPGQAIARRVDELARDPRSLHRAQQRAAEQAAAAHTLLVVDQFEELFTLCRSVTEQASFVDNLLTAACEPGGPTIVVLALRADFYSQCARFDRLRQALARHQEYLGPMTAEELRRAIEEPARRGGWELEPGLAELLLQDVGADGQRLAEPGALPLLSHALLETWQHRRGRILTLGGYTASGGVRGAIAETAETVFQDVLDLPQRAIARQIFLRLTELGEEGAMTYTRRRAAFAELIPNGAEAAAVLEVLKTLADARLITTEPDAAEVAHEALIREWPTLRRWLEEDREGLWLHRHLTVAAQDWDQLRREPGALYRGARLAQALEWTEQTEHAQDLNALERGFLQASKDFAEREAAEREAQRRRELETARKLAEAEAQRAAVQTRSASALRQRALYLFGALVLALVLGSAALFFGAQARQTAVAAQQSARLAQARELAAAALANLGVDPERSILLALQAVDVTDQVDKTVVPEAEDALHRALQTSHIQLTLAGHTQSVGAVQFSADGTRLLTASQDGTARVWDAATGATLLTVGDGQKYGAVNVAAFSPDGKRLVTGHDDHTARVWDAVSGRELLTLTGHTDFVYSVAFSPDGTRLATGSNDGMIKIWDAIAGKELLSLSVSGAPVVAFSPDGTRLAAGSDDGKVTIWNAITGQVWLTLQQARSINGINFSPDGTRLAAAGMDGTAKVWSLAPNSAGPQGQLLLTLNLSGYGKSVAFSPDGTRLATADLGGKVVVWDAASGQEQLNLSGHVTAVYSVAFSPDGTRLATSGRDNTARVWDITPSHELLTLRGHAGPVSALAFNPDGTRLATASQDRTARLWDVTTGNAMVTFAGHTGGISHIAISRDGTRLATASRDQTAKVWSLAPGSVGDATNGRLLLTLPGQAGPLLAIAFSPDSARLATGGADKNVTVWDAATGQPQFTLSGHTKQVNAVAFSPDGTRLAASSLDKTAVVWDLATRQPVFTLSEIDVPNPGPILAIAFSPDGTRLATAGVAGTARVWSLPQGPGSAGDASPGIPTAKLLFMLVGHTAAVEAIAFSPDGKRLATASDDSTTKIWDAQTGQELMTLTGHTGGVFGVAFSPDGTRLATAGGDGVVRFYALRVEDLVALARQRVTRSLTPVECRQYLHLAECPAGH
jgi:WD40 repeat protein/transcriptional regulator with XRE-family HTH domain